MTTAGGGAADVFRPFADRPFLFLGGPPDNLSGDEFLESIPDGFYAVDDQLRFTYVNDFALNEWGLERERVIGRSILDLFPALADGDLLRALMGAVNRRHTTDLETAGVGVTRWIGVSVVPIRAGVAVWWRDAAPSRQARRALHLSESRFRALAASVPEILFTCDWRGRCRYVSARFADHTGAKAAEALGDGWRRVVRPEDLDELETRWREALAARSGLEVEIRLRCRDGDERWFLARTAPIRNARGRVVEWIGTCTDIHHLKVAQGALRESEARALRRADDERAASRAKDEFLALVSHELRSPLSAIASWAGVLRHQVTPEQRARALEGIEAGVRTQTQLVSNLMDLAMAQTGQLDVRLECLDLRELVRRIACGFEPQARALNLDLRVPAAGAPTVVLGDPIRLEQVLTNLISNALKFSRPGGHVAVRLKETERSARIVVADQGEGIEPEFLPRLFEPFAQGLAGQRQRTGGLGLGLAIVRRIVELHGGAVSARSEGPQKGAAFTVELPLAGDAAVQTDPTAQA